MWERRESKQPAPESSPPAPGLALCTQPLPGLAWGPEAELERKAVRVPPCARRETIGRKAARVPPRAGRGGLSSLAGPAPAGLPGSGCAPGCGPQEREQKIRLALCSPGYSSFLPDAAGDWPRSRDVGGSAHAPAQPCGWVRRARGSACFLPKS